jgi:hypothetical protein
MIKPYLSKDKILEKMLTTPERKASFLFAKLHEGEEVPNSEPGTFYDTTWMEELDGHEVQILEDDTIVIRTNEIAEHQTTKHFEIKQPYKDAYIVWK